MLSSAGYTGMVFSKFNMLRWNCMQVPKVDEYVGTFDKISSKSFVPPTIKEALTNLF